MISFKPTEAIALDIQRDGQSVGCLVVGREGEALVIQSLVATGNIIPEIDDYCAALARDLGLKAVACKTRRPGMIKVLQKRGWAVLSREA